MAKQKTLQKAKEPVRIRFKALANGNKSIYLDIYKDGARSYQFLKLYLIPETSQAAKVANATTLQAANAIKAQMVIDIANGKAGIKQNEGCSNILLVDWLAHIKQTKMETSQSSKYANQIQSTINQIKRHKADVTLKMVDEAFCKGFVDYLKTCKQANHTGKNLSDKAVRSYFNMLGVALNQAEHDGLIQYNPIKRMNKADKPKHTPSTRAYLTIEEIKGLIATPCKREHIKTAFLFSCFCGLRLSDIETLKWGDVETSNGKVRICKKMVKTSDTIYLPLSAEALKWMPERKGAGDNENVFVMQGHTTMCYHIKEWAKAAGIKKDITFHVARHTFATTMLTLGADLYTTSKLLGHKNIATTQIYAKIVDKKKDEAVNLVNGIF